MFHTVWWTSLAETFRRETQALSVRLTGLLQPPDTKHDDAQCCAPLLPRHRAETGAAGASLAATRWPLHRIRITE